MWAARLILVAPPPSEYLLGNFATEIRAMQIPLPRAGKWLAIAERMKIGDCHPVEGYGQADALKKALKRLGYHGVQRMGKDYVIRVFRDK